MLLKFYILVSLLIIFVSTYTLLANCVVGFAWHISGYKLS